jgi:hypothetical protein
MCVYDCLHTKFHMITSDGPSAIVFKLKAKEMFCSIAFCKMEPEYVLNIYSYYHTQFKDSLLGDVSVDSTSNFRVMFPLVIVDN